MEDARPIPLRDLPCLRVLSGVWNPPPPRPVLLRPASRASTCPCFHLYTLLPPLSTSIGKSVFFSTYSLFIFFSPQSSRFSLLSPLSTVPVTSSLHKPLPASTSTLLPPPSTCIGLSVLFSTSSTFVFSPQSSLSFPFSSPTSHLSPLHCICYLHFCLHLLPKLFTSSISVFFTSAIFSALSSSLYPLPALLSEPTSFTSIDLSVSFSTSSTTVIFHLYYILSLLSPLLLSPPSLPSLLSLSPSVSHLLSSLSLLSRLHSPPPIR